MVSGGLKATIEMKNKEKKTKNGKAKDKDSWSKR